MAFHRSQIIFTGIAHFLKTNLVIDERDVELAGAPQGGAVGGPSCSL